MTKAQSARINNILADIRRLPEGSKTVLFSRLKKEIAHKEFIDLLDEFKTDEISEEEIIAEVEAVRQERYESRLLESNH